MKVGQGIRVNTTERRMNRVQSSMRKKRQGMQSNEARGGGKCIVNKMMRR